MALSDALLSKNQKDENSEKNYRCALRAKKKKKISNKRHRSDAVFYLKSNETIKIKNTEVMQYSTPCLYL